ncbi:hypothetical protein BROUX41_005694 [Berkeleyomyces rouxiae]|uniref:uncharacterized protein n=1 Tax=Berkeleyomyces rouxiae TaxID=2035830 RepID=UPI003B770235
MPSSEDGEIPEFTSADSHMKAKSSALKTSVARNNVDHVYRHGSRYENGTVSPDYRPHSSLLNHANKSRYSPSSARSAKRSRNDRERNDSSRVRDNYTSSNKRPEETRRLRNYDDPGQSPTRASSRRDYYGNHDRNHDRNDRLMRHGGRCHSQNTNNGSFDKGPRNRSRSRSPPASNNEARVSRDTKSSSIGDRTDGVSKKHRQVAFSFNGDVVMTTDDTLDAPELLAIDEEAEIERRKRRRTELLAKAQEATASPVSDPALSSTSSNITKASKSFAHTAASVTMPVNSPTTPTFSDDMANKIKLAPSSRENALSTDSDSHTPIESRHEKAIPDESYYHQRKQEHPVRCEDQSRHIDDADDDDDDMFADNFNVSAGKAKTIPDSEGAGGLLEEVDKDGYYKIRIGDILAGRYQLQSTLGKGMFSGVARAIDLTTKELVAVKIIRNNDALRKGGLTEVTILQKLNEADPENRKHVIRFDRSFEHKGHLCMVFENLSLNLREVLKKFGNNVGINLNATRAYAYQIFVALAHMQACTIIHADLKPDNILVNENRKVLKICDLGTAIDRSDAATSHDEVAPYLVSRFYRAPEIILGIPYDYAVDMWSIGCTLYELYTGKILFTGDNNNQMLKAIQEIRGRITPKMFKRGQLSDAHFDDKGNFISVETDNVLGNATVKVLPMTKPTRDLRQRLMSATSEMEEGETQDLALFVDLLEHCLALNPDRRIKPAEALRHPFFKTRLAN